MSAPPTNPFDPPTPANGQPPSLHPPPPASSSSNPQASSSAIWPFSDPSLLFYIDPHSQKAAAMQSNLERKTASGLPFPTTIVLAEASHVVLDPDCDDNKLLRSLPRPQRVVSLDWLRDSFLNEVSLPEEEYEVELAVEEEEEEEDDGPRDSDFVSRFPRPKGYLVAEEEDMALFLASDPQLDGSLESWVVYSKSHPSRTATGYRERYRTRKRVYFDLKLDQIRSAANGQPIVYVHPEVVETEEQSEDDEGPKEEKVVYLHKPSTRTTLASSQILPASRPRPVASRTCCNCETDQGTYWHHLHGKGSEYWFCNMCRTAHYSANQRESGTGDQALAARRRKILGDGVGDLSEAGSDASDVEDVRQRGRNFDSTTAPSSSSAPSRVARAANNFHWTDAETNDLISLLSSSSTKSSAARAFIKLHPRRSAHGVISHYHCYREPFDRAVERLRASGASSSKSNVEFAAQPWFRWTEEEDSVLLEMVDRRTGSKQGAFAEFSMKYPERTPAAVCSRHHLLSNRYRSRKSGKGTRPGAAVSESEELEDDSAGVDEDSDDGGPPFSKPSSVNLVGDRKRSRGSPSSSKNKRRRIESPVASSSKPSSNYHRHSLPSSSYQRPHSPPCSSRPNHPPNPRTSLPNPYRRSTPLPPSPPPRRDSESDDDHLEPPSFLQIGSKPSTCSPTSSWCFFCGGNDSPTFNLIPLAAKSLLTVGDAFVSVPRRLACDLCEESWKRRVIRGKKLGPGVAEMGEMERLAWVTEVLVQKGLDERTFRVTGGGRRAEGFEADFLSSSLS